jgi:solute carrier family 25 oxoglutarate transporter 11
MTDAKQLNPVWAAVKPFFNGGASGMLATCLIQPIDMVKVRIQLGDKGSPVSAAPAAARTPGAAQPT